MRKSLIALAVLAALACGSEISLSCDSLVVVKPIDSIWVGPWSSTTPPTEPGIYELKKSIDTTAWEMIGVILPELPDDTTRWNLKYGEPIYRCVVDTTYVWYKHTCPHPIEWWQSNWNWNGITDVLDTGVTP